MASRLIGTWPTTGDGGRAEEFFRVGADEGDAEQVAVALVDDHAGAAGAAVGVQAGPGTAWPAAAFRQGGQLNRAGVRQGPRSLLVLMMWTASGPPTLDSCHVPAADS